MTLFRNGLRTDEEGEAAVEGEEASGEGERGPFEEPALLVLRDGMSGGSLAPVPPEVGSGEGIRGCEAW